MGQNITHITVGKIVDKGVTDTNNMGAAMAPAAHDTILSHFNDTGRSPSSYDMIFTGDLGTLGSELLIELLRKDGIAPAPPQSTKYWYIPAPLRITPAVT